MSKRLITQWTENLLRTALDDLESFAWVLVWTVLRSIEKPTVIEKQWIMSLASEKSYSDLAMTKGGIAAFFKVEEWQTTSDKMSSVMPLLTEWFTLAHTASRSLATILGEGKFSKSLDTLKIEADLEALTMEYYVKYLAAGTRFLDINNQYN
jgi:hypothetical protein